jgi:hypothetical protein
MPSSSLLNFEKNLITDVNRLIKSHSDLNHDGLGRRGLGHITRSGVVMLCAAWERYIEDVLIDSVNYLTGDIDLPTQLPTEIQKTISKEIKRDKDELRCLALAGAGWKDFYLECIKAKCERLNTPKSTLINSLFKEYTGLDEISSSWSKGATEIDDFVSERGAIAHTGCEAKYINIGDLKKYKQLIELTILETDNYLADHLQELSSSGKSPWRRRNKK